MCVQPETCMPTEPLLDGPWSPSVSVTAEMQGFAWQETEQSGGGVRAPPMHLLSNPSSPSLRHGFIPCFFFEELFL